MKRQAVDHNRQVHRLPRATRRRFRAQTLHRCSCGDVFVVEVFDLDSQGNTGYRWKYTGIGEQRC